MLGECQLFLLPGEVILQRLILLSCLPKIFSISSLNMPIPYKQSATAHALISVHPEPHAHPRKYVSWSQMPFARPTLIVALSDHSVDAAS